MNHAAERSVVVITDGAELGCAIGKVLTACCSERVAVFSFTYKECGALLTPLRVEETSLFVLEIFRSYDGGLRAEGVVLANRWRGQKPSLVISPLHLGRLLQYDGYWDTASDESLAARVDRLLRFPKKYLEGGSCLAEYFQAMFVIPQQHSNAQSKKVR